MYNWTTHFPLHCSTFVLKLARWHSLVVNKCCAVYIRSKEILLLSLDFGAEFNVCSVSILVNVVAEKFAAIVFG